MRAVLTHERAVVTNPEPSATHLDCSGHILAALIQGFIEPRFARTALLYAFIPPKRAREVLAVYIPLLADLDLLPLVIFLDGISAGTSPQM